MNKRELYEFAKATIDKAGKAPRGCHWICLGSDAGEMEALDVRTVKRCGALVVHKSIDKHVVSDGASGLAIAHFRVKTHATNYAARLGPTWSAENMIQQLERTL